MADLHLVGDEDAARELQARLELRRDLERSVVSALFIDPGQIAEVAELVPPTVFSELPLQRIYAAMLRVEPVDLRTVADELYRSEELGRAGGLGFLSEVAGHVSTAANVVHHARRLLRHHLEGQARDFALVLARGDGDDATETSLKVTRDEIRELDSGGAALFELGFSGERLVKLRQRVRPDSMLPGVLDREPGIHLLTGRPKTGKTRLALWLALCFAKGESPWEGAPDLPRSFVTILSAEQPAIRIDQTLRQLEPFTPRPDIARWTENVTILGRDSELAARARRMMSLDRTARAMLRAALQRDRERGRPCKLLIADSLSRLAPPGIDENSAGEMTDFLQPLQELAEDFGLWLILVHHQGHATDPSRLDAIGAGRGSSAISAVTPVALNVAHVPNEPRRRSLRVSGNDVPGGLLTFDVSRDGTPEDAVLFFEKIESSLLEKIDEYMTPGESITQSELAYRLRGVAPEQRTKRPDGRAQARAKKVAEEWARAGLVTIERHMGVMWIRRPGAAFSDDPSLY